MTRFTFTAVGDPVTLSRLRAIVESATRQGVAENSPVVAYPRRWYSRRKWKRPISPAAIQVVGSVE